MLSVVLSILRVNKLFENLHKQVYRHYQVSNGKAIDDVPKTGFEPATPGYEPDKSTTALSRVIGVCLGRRGENWQQGEDSNF
jgi:hypothetical protein